MGKGILGGYLYELGSARHYFTTLAWGLSILVTRVFFEVICHIDWWAPGHVPLLMCSLPQKFALVPGRSHTEFSIASRWTLTWEAVCLLLVCCFRPATSLFCWRIKYQPLVESGRCVWENLLLLLLFQFAQRWEKLFITSTNVLWLSLPPFMCVFIKRLIRETERKRRRERGRQRGKPGPEPRNGLWVRLHLCCKSSAVRQGQVAVPFQG